MWSCGRHTIAYHFITGDHATTHCNTCSVLLHLHLDGLNVPFYVRQSFSLPSYSFAKKCHCFVLLVSSFALLSTQLASLVVQTQRRNPYLLLNQHFFLYIHQQLNTLKRLLPRRSHYWIVRVLPSNMSSGHWSESGGGGGGFEKFAAPGPPKIQAICFFLRVRQE